MVVQHNLRAINSNRMLGITSGILSKSAEKLSSGYKVNRAADDAAGLSISEKMRKQIRGLTQATMNAEDGISSVQTAEGALTEVHDMLQRMNELANKASNGTNSVSDRQTIQDEVDQLLTEIDRVSETTKFNEIYLLKGNAQGTESDELVNAHDAGIKGTLKDKGGAAATFELKKALEDGDKINIAGMEYTIDSKAASSGIILDKSDMNTKTDGYLITTSLATQTLGAGDSFSASGKEYKVVDNISVTEMSLATGDVFTIGDLYYSVASSTAASPSDGSDSTKAIALSSDDAKEKIKSALNKKQQVKTVKVTSPDEDSTNTDAAVTASFIVIPDSERAANEITLAGQATNKKTFADLARKAINKGAAYSTKAGDSITTEAGVTKTATSKTPATAQSVYESIDALDPGDTVTIGEGNESKTYTIVADTANEDEGAYELHKNSILAKIYDRNTVNWTGGTAVTVIGDIANKNGVPGAKNSSITAADAYKKIADALKQASSIGTDEGKEASVVNNGDGTFKITKGTAKVTDALAFNLHVGADADMTNKISVDIKTMDTKGLGIQKLDVVGKDANGNKIDDGGMAATYAIDSISDAIAKVSAQRSLLGAVQNRLDHTINNLENVVENTTAAESQIRDTDMATEMVKFANSNILAQAGQSMLAQANQANQGVLSLLG